MIYTFDNDCVIYQGCNIFLIKENQVKVCRYFFLGCATCEDALRLQLSSFYTNVPIVSAVCNMKSFVKQIILTLFSEHNDILKRKNVYI